MTMWADGLASAVRSGSTAGGARREGVSARCSLSSWMRAARRGRSAWARLRPRVPSRTGGVSSTPSKWWGPDDAVGGNPSVFATSGLAHRGGHRLGAHVPVCGRRYLSSWRSSTGAPLRELSPRFQLSNAWSIAGRGSGVRRQGRLGVRVHRARTGARRLRCNGARSGRGGQPLLVGTERWPAEEEELGRLVGTLDARERFPSTTCAPNWGPAASRSPRPLEPGRCARPTPPLLPRHWPRCTPRPTSPAGAPGHVHGPARAGLPRPWGSPEPLAARAGGWRAPAVRRTRHPLQNRLLGRRRRRTSCPSSWSWPPRTPTRSGASARGTGPRRRQPGGPAHTAARCGWCPRPRTARLELRVPGADTSPHHCLAMFLGAAIGESRSGSNRRRRSSRRRTGGRRRAARSPTTSPTARPLRCQHRGKRLFGPAFVEHFASPGGPRRRPATASSPLRSGTATWTRSDHGGERVKQDG